MILESILARRRLCLGIGAVVALIAVIGLPRLQTNNSPEAFFLRGDPDVERYHALRERFGSDQLLRIVASGEGLWTEAGLAWLGEIETRAKEVPGVEGATGPAGQHQPFFGVWPPSDARAFAEIGRADPLDLELGIFDRQGETASVLVILAPAEPVERLKVVARVRALGESPPEGVEVELIGAPVLDEALEISSEQVLHRFFPLLAALSILLLVVTIREPSGIVLPLLFVGFCEAVTVGAMAWVGAELNLVMTVLPPLLFVVSLATAVHLTVRLADFRERGLELLEAVRATYRDKGWAVFWTGLTTMVGFGSLATSRVGPVRSLGLWSAWGIGIMILAAFTLFPVLLASWGPRRARRRTLEQRLSVIGRRLAETMERRRAAVLAVAVAMALAAAAGVARLGVESNVLNYFEPDHPARAGIERLQDLGVGSAAVELVLSMPPESPSLALPKGLGRLSDLSAALREAPSVYGALGGGDLADAVGRRSGMGALALGPFLAQPEGKEALAAFVTEDGSSARLTVFTRTAGVGALRALSEEVYAATREVFPESEAEITGQYTLLLRTQTQLFTTLGGSLSLTFICVALILRLLVGSTRLMLMALIPTLLPVLLVLGGMGWIGVPLDVATVIVGSVLLGLGVDLTIHTLGHYRTLAPKLGAGEAVAGALERSAAAFVLTGVILAMGFGVCAASSFAPTARFGALAASGILLAVAGALTVLPALLGCVPDSVTRKLGRSSR